MMVVPDVNSSQVHVHVLLVAERIKLLNILEAYCY